MGIENVNTTFRELDIANEYGADLYDTCEMIIRHNYQPSENYCKCELKMPSIKRQMPESQYDKVVYSSISPSIHGIKFEEVNNNEFYAYLRDKEWETVDKIRRVHNGMAYTYYFSNTIPLKLFEHDYYMAALIYLNYPLRNYIRRIPCRELSSECTKCPDTLAAPVKNLLYEATPELSASMDKYFFTNMGEVHRITLGYTIEVEKTPGECFTTAIPEYFILDESAYYFNGGFLDHSEYEASIFKTRKEDTDDMYITYVGGPVKVTSYGSPTGLNKVNYLRGENLPDDYKNILDSSDFNALWDFDFRNLNMRNSIHKWQFNHWIDVCIRADDGHWCAWNVTEVISSGAEEGVALGDGGAAGGQLTQVAGMFGWAPSKDESSTDTVYNFISIGEIGVDYPAVIEPLPNRKLSMV